MSVKSMFAAVAIAVVAISGPVLAAEFKMNGSATLAKGPISANKAAIEAESGMTLVMVPNGSANGIKDLIAGRVEAAMISAPLKVEADLANAKEAGSVDTTGLVEHPVGTTEISFIVNPNAPVKALSADQLKAVFSGKVTNWKDLGGPDQPIMLAVEQPGNGTRAVIVSQFLGGADMPSSARVMNALAQVALVVSQAPNAIGYGNATTISSSVAVVDGIVVKQPLAIVTKGAPSPEAQKVIAAVRNHAGG